MHVEIDDARHFILTTKQKFDAVTSDPLDPWVKGAATLYTKEFFDVVKEHLNPGGVVTLFVQLYESSPEAVKSEVATFFQAFPNGVVFGNTNNGAGYDLVLVGQMGTMHINVDDIEQRLQSPAVRAGRAVAARDRHQLGDGTVRDIRRQRADAPSLARRRADQSRPQPAAAVPRRPWSEPLRPGVRSTGRCSSTVASRTGCSPARPRIAQIRMALGRLRIGDQRAQSTDA